MDDEQQAFVFEEIETGIAAIRAQVSKGRERPDGKRPLRPRKGFAPHRERVEVVIEPEELPEHAGKQKVLIGEDVSERLDVVPGAAHIIESGIPTEALLAQIAVSKYADGLPPLCRQEAIYARDKVELDRKLMAQWIGKLGFELEILADYLFEGGADLRRRNHLADARSQLRIDEDSLLWAYAKDDRPFGGSGPPMVVYRFEDGRGRRVRRGISRAAAASGKSTAMPPITR